MSVKRKKVVVAVSGGVDSSVAACLLVEQGYDVVGLFMRVGAGETETTGDAHRDRGGDPKSPGHDPAPHQGCCSANDAVDARFVAGMLNIPFYALNFQEDFEQIIADFADEYARGRTPNPCIVCNDRLKFGKLLDYADAIGADYVATGHYARVAIRDGRKVLMRARDARKDQSYVLFGLDRSALDRVLFPLGDLNKPEVRDLASRFGLPNHDKPDSVEICFVPDRDYAAVVRRRRPDAFVEGDVVDQGGDVIGQHSGIGQYTIGQRRGLGIAAGKPIYVTGLDVAANKVTVGDVDALLADSLIASRANFLIDPPRGRFRAHVKIRYLHNATPATVERIGERTVHVVFDEPQRAVTPGQAVVFYDDDDVVVGGAWIDRAEATARTSPAASSTTL